MNKSIIEIKNIGKKYNITHQRGGYIALRDILASILRNPFKFAKHKARQAVGLETKEEFWALKDINLEINKGDIIGIIGHNGAGKSTLLKILTGITPPTEGEIIMRGRVASLLEVGTGFHPELTGRENIFLNGAILGMTKKEIVKKFDEIVAFSGVEKFLDTPVKYYSSGMYVRLAFSVAAHMEPDILLVDEVLAVGDAEFQKKCLGKMEEVTKKDGRTILLVSHNMGAIRSLCKKTILIQGGRVEKVGETNEVIEHYLSKGSGIENLNNKPRIGSGEIKLSSISLVNNKGSQINGVGYREDLKFKLGYTAKESIKDLIVSIGIYSSEGDYLGAYSTFEKRGFNVSPGEGSIFFLCGPTNLMADTYKINVTIHTNGTFLSVADHITDAFTFDIYPSENFPRWMDHGFYGTGVLEKK